ncbi:MAG: helix-turn-helix transcriptional regulator [Desulfatibacillum sp.]|nr:helix-turn-helix transcriptional regulator [Desulfatibacillum sp.]
MEIDFVSIPVFNAGAGEPSHFTDGDTPLGVSDEYIPVPASKVDENSFAVRVQGDSMAPRIVQGDIAVVVPSRHPEQGKVCFATWSDDPSGQRLIKRFYKYGNTVVLRSDNPDHEEITLDEHTGQHVRIFRVVMIVSVDV